jgi:hypothetical protein
MDYQLIELSPADQQSLVNYCNTFKTNLIAHGKAKKNQDVEIFAALNNQFSDTTYLMPARTIEVGTQKAVQSTLEPIFFPLILQLYLIGISVLMSSIISTDDDWFRVRAKTSQWVTSETGVNEDDYTEALKYYFREKNVTEKLKDFISTSLWSSSPCAYVGMLERPEYEYKPVFSDPLSGGVVENPSEDMLPYLTPMGVAPKWTQNKKKVFVEALNPLLLYIEPEVYDEDYCSWGYFAYKKRRDLLDDPYCQNKDSIEAFSEEGTGISTQASGVYSQFQAIKGLSANFTSKDGQMRHDMYYFPYVRAGVTELRNVTVCVCEERILTHILPNFLPGGKNPLVFGTIEPGVDKPYNNAPLANALPYQRQINRMENYMMEVMARIGNLFNVREGTDISQLFGAAGGILFSDNPGQDVVPLTGDFSEVANLRNQIGVYKMEAQAAAGIFQPFQGSSDVDEKKTATEINISSNQQMGIMDERADRMGSHVRRIMERVLFYLPQISDAVMSIPVVDQETGQTSYKDVDLSYLTSDNYTIELVSISPAQSKNAQAQFLTQLAMQLGSNPEALMSGVAPLIQKIGELNGIKDIKTLLQQVKEGNEVYLQFEQFREQLALQRQLEAEAGMGAGEQPGVVGLPVADTGQGGGIA